MSDITPEELRKLADDGDAIDWYGPGNRFTDPLREAADTIEHQAARIAELEAVECTCGDSLTEGAACVNCHVSVWAAYELKRARIAELEAENTRLAKHVDRLCHDTMVAGEFRQVLEARIAELEQYVTELRANHSP